MQRHVARQNRGGSLLHVFTRYSADRPTGRDVNPQKRFAIAGTRSPARETHALPPRGCVVDLYLLDGAA